MTLWGVTGADSDFFSLKHQNEHTLNKYGVASSGEINEARTDCLAVEVVPSADGDFSLRIPNKLKIEE